MSNYEFWDELGKIFNAVVAYQEKSIEFNKNFINPWIRLGNVFDKEDRNREAVAAYQKAIELDPSNAQNWYELGNVHFRMEKYDEATEAYSKAIDLNPQSGWPYNNLALTLVSQGKYTEAIPLYLKGIDLLEETKDKAVAWNRLGNVYRKLNQYENAVQAFQKADQLDGENAGFHDELDEETAEAPALPDTEGVSVPDESGFISPIELILAQSEADEAAAQVEAQQTAPSLEASPAADQAEIPVAVDTTVNVPVAEESMEPVADIASEATLEETPSIVEAEDAQAMQGVSSESVDEVADIVEIEPVATMETEENNEEAVETPAASEDPIAQPVAEEPDVTEQTMTVVAQDTVETYTEPPTVPHVATETVEMAAIEGPEFDEASSGEVEEPVIDSTDTDSAFEEVDEAAETIETPVAEENISIDEPELAEAVSTVNETAEENAVEEPAPAEENAEPVLEEAATEALASEHAAYEEFLKDNSETLHIEVTRETTVEEITINSPDVLAHEPMTKIDASGDFQIEMDTKSAHVWNELGNVYFNNGSFDDAIIAYSKAIELDRRFAWPYSNLALTYVQKSRFAEAILLYQRSIELFSSEKDKAISWNRLGNVYRRLNDYDNAIASYQRADDLDPNNTSLSMQSRFSLLGNYYLEPKTTYAS
ncbi:MAG TPA: tetratricopeptide repeat protein [Anaerolineales bacterium]|jgi:tetratricopeptide (TPR) repeat protein|nr:tetratricopeptide repeat protein [Anaerolineales bacterium]